MRLIPMLMLAPGLLITALSNSSADNGDRPPCPKATGFLTRSQQAGNRSVPYCLYVPRDYDPAQPWPLVVFLHGAGERGTDGLRQTEVGIGRAIRRNPERFPCLVLMPQCPEEQFWDRISDAMDAMIKTVREEYNIDPRRITLTGLSMGGYGTWTWGALRADLFAAYLPICGGGIPQDLAHICSDFDPEFFGKLEDRVKQLARRPIRAFHGRQDKTVPPAASVLMSNLVRKAGGKVDLKIYRKLGHNSWDDTYGDPEVIEWLLNQRLPDREIPE